MYALAFKPKLDPVIVISPLTGVTVLLEESRVGIPVVLYVNFHPLGMAQADSTESFKNT